MELRELGKTGKMVPQIGVGVWRYGGGVEPLLSAIKSGATLIDTAEAYGSEGVVGQALKGIRDQVFVATKVSGSHLNYDDVLKAADASLRRLDTDYIDLYQVHWPNSLVPIRDTMRAMETLVDRGLVKYLGVSNFSVAALRDAQAAMTKHQIVSNQVLYNLNRRQIEAELLPFCRANQITVIAYTPLDSGHLAISSAASAHPERMKVIEAVAAQTGKTLAQVALNWVISQPGIIAIPKSDRTARVVENCAASGWQLSPAQIDLLNSSFPASSR
jgi:diketogulonate reductase-like aldo/keto reductase